jgi:MoaA/NifB/PqqE/SkfB family radical SAM enzyme
MSVNLGAFNAVNLGKLLRRSLEPVAYRFDAAFVKPSNITLSLTNRCNLRCPTCAYWKTPNEAKETELTLEEMVRLLGQLREWLGPFMLGLTGGEPFLRPEIFDLLDEAARLGISTTTVNNGSLLPPRRIERLKQTPIHLVSFSLNHLDPVRHDETRGVTGSAGKIFDAIDQLNYPGRQFRITLSTLLMGTTIDHLPDMVRWVRDKKLDGITFQILYFESGNEAYVPGWYKSSPFWDDDADKINRGMDALIALKRQGLPISNSIAQMEAMRGYLLDPEGPQTVPCKVGVANMDIEPDGAVRLCDVMEAVGNVRETHPRDIWESALAAERRRQIHGCGAACRIKTCNFRQPVLSLVKGQLFPP